jgi:hypothetical protein
VQVTNTTGGAQHLITKDTTYLNFDLKVEWRVPNAGNSGIFTRYLEINEWGGASGAEAQVVDINHPDGTSKLHRAGCDYDMFGLDAGKDNWWNPTGKWNQFRIIAYGTRVAHYGNGKKLLEYTINSPAWTAAFNSSKYKGYPHYAEVHSGSIYFQHHGELGPAYRDIRIKKLNSSQDPWANGSPYLNTAGTGLVDVLTFNDNLFGSPTNINLQGAAGMNGLRIVGGEAPALYFPKRGDYGIRILGVDGRTAEAVTVRNAESYSLPLSNGAARVLEVTSGGKTLHHSVLSSR